MLTCIDWASPTLQLQIIAARRSQISSENSIDVYLMPLVPVQELSLEIQVLRFKRHGTMLESLVICKRNSLRQPQTPSMLIPRQAVISCKYILYSNSNHFFNLVIQHVLSLWKKMRRLSSMPLGTDMSKQLKQVLKLVNQE